MSSLPLMCARLRSELGLVEPQTKALIDKACEEIGVERAGSLVERARACLKELGVSSPIDHHSEGEFGNSF